MITLLGIISFYLGVHWGFQQDAMRGSGVDASLVDEAYWIFNLFQVFVVTFFCTLPDLVLRQLSLFMAASKVLTLVVTLLVVVLGGMYLLYWPGFIAADARHCRGTGGGTPNNSGTGRSKPKCSPGGKLFKTNAQGVWRKYISCRCQL